MRFELEVGAEPHRAFSTLKIFGDIRDVDAATTWTASNWIVEILVLIIVRLKQINDLKLWNLNNFLQLN